MRIRNERFDTEDSGSLWLNETVELIDNWTFTQNLQFTLPGLEEVLDFELETFNFNWYAHFRKIRFGDKEIPVSFKTANLGWNEYDTEIDWNFDNDNWRGSLFIKSRDTTLTLTREKDPKIELAQTWRLDSNNYSERNQTLTFGETQRSFETSELGVMGWRANTRSNTYDGALEY